MATLRTEPGVESEIGQQGQTIPVTGGLNVIVPVDSPSGVSDPTQCSSTNYFYNNYGSSSKPASTDSPSMLQAASLLNSGTAVWVIRCHENKILEGITDSGERFYVDKAGNLIKNRVDITITPPSNIYDNMYLAFKGETDEDNVCIFCGTKPSITGVPEEGYIALDIEEPSYTAFFEALKVLVTDKLTLIINGDSDDGYTIYCDKAISEASSNIVSYTTETLTNTIKLDIPAESVFTMKEYFMVNSESFHIAGASVNSNKYPSKDTELSFVANKDEEPGSLVAPYLFNELITKYKKFVLSCAAKITKGVSSIVYTEVTPTPKYIQVTPQEGDSPSVLGWYEKDEENHYFPTTDTEVSYNSVTPAGTENPQELGWYEYDHAQEKYVLTTDTTVDESKLYYTQKVYYQQDGYVENPHEEGWYEETESGYSSDVTEDTVVDPTKTYVKKENAELDVRISNIPESALVYDEEEHIFTAKPSTEIVKDAYIILGVAGKYLVVRSKSVAIPDDINKDDVAVDFTIEGNTTAYKMLTLVSELRDLFKNNSGIDLTFTESYADLSINLNASKLVSYAYVLPTDSTLKIVNTYVGQFVGSNVNTQNIRFNDVSLFIDDTQYIVGNPELVKTSVVVLSAYSATLNEITEKFANAMGNQFNAYVANNGISCFFVGSYLPELAATGLGISKVISNYSTVKQDNKFGVVLNFNSKAKVANFSYTYDNGTDLFDFSVTVNGVKFSSNIQFADASRTDGYGKSLYYQYVNDNFPQITIIPFEGELEQTSFESPAFGDSINFNEASTADLDTALAKLKNYKFTKWEILLDGGFVSPAGYAVLNKWASKLHMEVDGGTPEYSQKEDVLSWREQLPASTSYVTIAYPPIKDSSFDGFSVNQSAGVAHVKRIIENRSSRNEFLPIFGADRGVISGKPLFNVNDEDVRNELLTVGINTIYYSNELKLSFVNDNSTLLQEEGPLQEENIQRMANAATHVAEMWLDLNAVGHFNCLKLRTGIVSGVEETIADRLKSAEPCYKDLIVVCDETNGNDDSKTVVYVDAYLTPYRSTKQVHLFTLVKSVSNEQTQNS